MSDAITGTGPALVELASLRERSERDAQAARLASKAPNEVTFLIEGREIPILSARISRSIDTVADPWSVEIEWIPGRDAELDKRVAPFTYAQAQIYIGSRLVNTGFIYRVRNRFGKRGLTKTLECASYTANLVDSDLPASGMSWEWQNSTLYAIASNICSALAVSPPLSVGISQSITGAAYTRVSEPFDFVQASLTDKCSEILTKLAFQRGALVTNDRYGMLLITMGASTGPIVATLGEGDISAYRENLINTNAKSEGWEIDFDGRKRFNQYNVYSMAGDGVPISGQAIDSKVISGRVTNIVVPDNTGGNVGVTAAWHRSRQIVQALTVPFPMVGFFTPAGSLWNPNDMVMVMAPSLDINTATQMLVRQIDYEHTAEGQTCTLFIVPPQAYTGTDLIEPWAGKWQ